METTIMGYILGLYWGYIGIMEKKMETTILGYSDMAQGLPYLLHRRVVVLELYGLFLCLAGL